jgi:hypothetical protein
MTLSYTTVTLLFLAVLLTLAAVATVVSVAVIAAWWLIRRTRLLPVQSRLGQAFERLFDHFWRSTPVVQLQKWYTWEFPIRPGLGYRRPGSRFFMELQVNKQRYVQYQQRPRELNPTRFDTYVTISTPEVEALARQLRHLAQTQGYSPYDQLCNTLAFVQQNIRYTDDLSPQTGQLIEYPRYPLETLVDKKGDCEDQSILTATLLAAMGYSVALLILPIHVALGIAGFDDKPGSRVVHAATGVCYLYVETTAPNWLPGEVPREFRAHLASGQFEVLPVVKSDPN